jgi:hypothetical protein
VIMKSICYNLMSFFVLNILTHSLYTSRHHNFNYSIKSKLNAFSVTNRAEWYADDDSNLSRDTASKRKFDGNFITNLDTTIGSLVTVFALNTVSYYMLEFRDEVTEKWMMGFSQYKQNGFENGIWTNYIEKMIKTDKLQVEVLMKATRVNTFKST